MAKRSPILGYNHNVKYRGIVFHVQTEDSGLMNPHLFTHLFHGGVIVSTRKLVYDAGSNEESVKSLMQAQHKAVMKDLRRGTFDDKIDQYMGDTPGLEPRGAAAAAAAAAALESPVPVEIIGEVQSEPIELPVKTRAPTGAFAPQIPAIGRANTSPQVSRHGDGVRVPMPAPAAPPLELRDSSPVIEMTVDDDEPSGRTRDPRDTAVDEIPPIATARATTPSRPPASHGAATLPAMKPPSRPIAPPVVTRPAAPERKRADSDVVEVYSPAPPSVEPPPGERAGERPGQYSMSRKEGVAPIREQTGRIAALNPSAPPPARRGDTGAPPPRGPTTQVRTSQPGPPTPPPPPRAPTPASGARAVPAAPGTPSARTHGTAPITNRATSSSPHAGSNVVMTRPAVIVGAPPKGNSPTQQRVRKAREDEGRGFGQGLISEKSLDEVILAYLSEDAEEK